MDTPQHNPDLKPKVDVHRRTTKVNFGVVIGVIVFVALAFFVVARIASDPKRAVEEQHENVENPNP